MPRIIDLPIETSITDTDFLPVFDTETSTTKRISVQGLADEIAAVSSVLSVNTRTGDVVGLAEAVDFSNVDNTADISKPISTAQQTALDAKVAGAASSTDNAIARFDSTTGKIIQNSNVTVSDAGNVVIPGTLDVTSDIVAQSDIFAGGVNTDFISENTTNAGVTIDGVLVKDSTVTGGLKPRVSTTTSSATPTINTDNYDMYGLTAQAANITSFTTNLSGTPTNGQKLWIYIVGTAARTITWGATFEAGPVALPTTTVTTQRLDVGFVWNSVTSKWRCVASGSA